MIHIYHGDGKGKTTCGMGLCLRAAGAGKKVLIFQFMKDGRSSERAALGQVKGITLMEGPEKVRFTGAMSPRERDAFAAYCREQLQVIKKRVAAEAFDLVFLDEVLYAVSKQLIPETQLIDMLRALPPSVEWVLTGRDPGRKLREMADYISEIRKEKHPYDKGIKARIGIEY